jgi:hypothetical protein
MRRRRRMISPMKSTTRRVDTQMVELAGRNWLASELLRAGIEIARPERDRGVDLIAYIDLDHRLKKFVACPIQMKAATGAIFSLDPKYAKFPRLILAYVWNLGELSQAKCFALTYAEAHAVAVTMGWTKTASWLRGGNVGRRGYSTTAPSKRLRKLLEPHEMDTRKWWSKISGLAR